MRVLVMFDLPVETAEERAAYVRFRKELIKDGYIMMQESVYSKLVLSPLAGDLARQRLKKICPKLGTVQVMTVTEKQYSDIEYIIGGPTALQINNTDRLVVF